MHRPLTATTLTYDLQVATSRTGRRSVMTKDTSTLDPALTAPERTLPAIAVAMDCAAPTMRQPRPKTA